MRDPGYPVFDADNHIYEPPEAILEHLPKRYARDIQFVQIGRHTRIAMRGQITEFMPNPTFEKVAPPGAHADFYRGTNSAGRTLREMSGEPIDCLPAFREPGPRLALLDELGVQWALMFPTLANLVEYTLIEDPDLTHVAVHSINEWLHEHWSYDYEGRIFTAPVITFPILDKALAEVDYVLERGARAVIVRPAPVKGLRGWRSIADPEYDPIWARLQEAGVVVCMHASFPPLTSYYQMWERPGSDSAFKPTPLKEMLLQHREAEDALAAMVCQGALSRFPDLKVLSVENGADWVPHLLQNLDLVYRRLPQEFSEHPVEVFKRNVFVNPFWENNVTELVRLVGADHVLFGSDYPHPEGMAEPLAYLDYLDSMPALDEATKRKIMSENGAGLLRVGHPVATA